MVAANWLGTGGCQEKTLAQPVRGYEPLGAVGLASLDCLRQVKAGSRVLTRRATRPATREDTRGTGVRASVNKSRHVKPL